MKTRKITLTLLIPILFISILGILLKKQEIYIKKSIVLNLLMQAKEDKDLKKYFTKISIEDKAFYYILSELLENPKWKSNLKEIFMGANIQLNDQGYYYNKWKSSPYSYKRTSSHQHKKGECFALSHLLFWLDQNKNTRFQIEATPFEGFFCSSLHFVDYIQYLVTNKQQGLIGSSIFTEQTPILLSEVIK